MYCKKEKELNKFKKIYLSGKVYNDDKIALTNTIIVVEEISEYSRWFVGYVVTNEKGEFNLTLDDSNASYKLTAFKDITII